MATGGITIDNINEGIERVFKRLNIMLLAF